MVLNRMKEIEKERLTTIQTKILEVLNVHGDMTREGICEKLGFDCYLVQHIQYYPRKRQPKSIYHRYIEQYDKRTTIHDNLVKLEKLNIVEKFSRNNGKMGRPPVLWSIKKLKEK